MTEKEPQSQEQKEKGDPTLEEIQVEIIRILEGQEFKEGEVLEDERGVYLYQAISVDPEDGERMDCVYQRENDSDRPSSKTVIDKTFYIGEDMVGGKPVAELDEETREWKYLD